MTHDFIYLAYNKMTLLLFDVDGTLTQSGKNISRQMKTVLVTLQQRGFHIGIVGGSVYKKIMIQMDGLQPEHVFSECGCVYNKQDDVIYKKNIRFHSNYQIIQNVLKEVFCFLSDVEYKLTGHFVDLRNGLVYISLVGMNALEHEREDFLRHDAQKHYRQRLLKILTRVLEGTEFTVVKGGQVGLAVYPTEWDKSQVLHFLSDYKVIHYFGDQCEPDGNDYPLFIDKRVIGHKVSSPDHTLELLKQLFKEKNKQ